MRKITFILFLIIFIGLNTLNAKSGDSGGNGNSGDKVSLKGPKTDPIDTTNINRGNQLQKQNRQFNKNRTIDNKQSSEQYNEMEKIRSKIRDCTALTEEIQDLAKNMAKEIIKKEENGRIIIEKYSIIKNKIALINEENSNFMNELDNDQKIEIESQARLIEKIKNKAFNINEIMDKELKNDKIDKKNILKLNLDLENEINKMERQYRAIEWLLEQ
ncbi:MAG: hypothetical protein JXB50_10950 [Spirochaetes bacterium]|nr:hypothetical protein [Spirochaetota bacterium]